MSGGGGGGGDNGGRDSHPEPIVPKKKGDAEAVIGGGGSGEGTSPCAIDEITFLNSPDATVISGIRVGDTLNIALLNSPSRLVARTSGAQIAGSITARFSRQLMLCIEADYEYEAEVLYIVGGACKVQVRLK